MARILVVDDVGSMRQIVRTVLESGRHRVLDACSAEEALDLAKVTRVHLVLTDINMPGMGGLELIPQLRALRTYRNTPIMILAKGSADENLEQAMKRGASGWVEKPFTPEGLLGAVNQVLVDFYVNH
ncbi:response regulator [Aromatoleum toluclasticum]|uniref:response regulator n=1 Tax=Aromatoleum toluclasticum TaxID=92003 RepID=UPI00038068B1|nr:response regulator [Aromatoleum toluclasticum]MCC4114056.1 response regulator [Aromatoleum toluclasticum]